MSALDYLLAGSLEELIQKKLGVKTYQKVEKRLNEHYGISVLEAIRALEKLKKDQGWITIREPKIAKLILESFGNPDKKIILDSSLTQPNVILDILNSGNIPKSSGYRVIKELLRDGLLAEKGYATTRDGKKISKYTSLFKRVRLDIHGDEISAQVQINAGFF